MRTYIHTQLYAHISCLYRCDGEFTLEQAKLTVVPEGDWHCAKCIKRAKAVNKSTSGTRKRTAVEIVHVTEESPVVATTTTTTATTAASSSTNKRARGKATAAAAVVKEEVPEEQVKPATRRSARK